MSVRERDETETDRMQVAFSSACLWLSDFLPNELKYPRWGGWLRIFTGEMEREQDEIQLLTFLMGIFSKQLDGWNESQTVNRDRLYKIIIKRSVDRLDYSFTVVGPASTEKERKESVSLPIWGMWEEKFKIGKAGRSSFSRLYPGLERHVELFTRNTESRKSLCWLAPYPLGIARSFEVNQVLQRR